MTTTTSRPTPTQSDLLRRRAFTAGALYLITFVSIPTLALYGPLHDPATFLLGTGSDAAVRWGALSEVVVALAGVGTAVVFFPVAKRQSETAALGLVASRVLEAALILVGVVCLLALLALRGSAGAEPASLVPTGQALVAAYDKTFLLAQSLAPVLNALCLGYVLYRSDSSRASSPSSGSSAHRCCWPRTSPSSSVCTTGWRRSPRSWRSRSPPGSSPSAST